MKDLMIRQLNNNVIVAEESPDQHIAHQSPAQTGEQVKKLTDKHFNTESGVQLIRAITGVRPVPQDRLPIQGYLSNIAGLYVSVMHSGVTLAPAMGRFTATEIIDGTPIGMLAPFRPDRFGQ